VNSLLSRVAVILDRRFMLVSFLPVLIFVAGLTTLIVSAAGKGAALIGWWSRLAGSMQIVFLLFFLAVAWLLAGFVESQLRRLFQLFEGYPLERVAPRLFARAAAWHDVYRRVLALKAGEDRDNVAKELSRWQQRRLRRTKRHQEELFVLYPEGERPFLPTRLGNVIRAAEDYTEVRYGADYLLVWPRLAHLCSERFIQDYEMARAKVDFLLVVSTLSALFGFIGGCTMLIVNGPVLLFVGLVLGGFGLARFAYSAAVDAAVEYGEQIRASMDLFRLELLRQLQFAEPADAAEEISSWKEFDRGLRYGAPRRSRYESPQRKPEDPPLGDPVA
jgi:hypothetical protein